MKLTLSGVVFAVLASTSLALTPWKEWEHGRVALEDVSIHFRYAGSGPPLLLVHGEFSTNIKLNPLEALTFFD